MSTVENAVTSFKTTGIYPCNSNIFTYAHFLPSEETDQPSEEELNDDDRIVVFNDDTVELGDVPPDISKAIRHDLPFIEVSLAANTKEVLQQDGNHSLVIETPSKEDTHLTKARLKTLGDIIPLPKIKIKRKRKGKGFMSELLSSTPNKERMEKEIIEKEKQTAQKKKRSTKMQKMRKKCGN